MTYGRFGFGFGLSSGHSPKSYDPAAVALFARMTVQPDAARKALINATILAIKAVGGGAAWALLDRLGFSAAHHVQAAKLNWKQPLYDLVAVNAPTFTVDRGFTGDGSSAYLNTQFNPVTAGGNFSQDSATIAVYNRTSRAADGTYTMGAASGPTGSMIASYFTGNVAFARVNDGGNSVVTAGSSGLIVGSRTDSAKRTTYRNGVSLGDVAIASSALLSQPIYIGGRNQGGALNGATTDNTAGDLIGGGLAASHILGVYNAMQAYMTAIGAQV